MSWERSAKRLINPVLLGLLTGAAVQSAAAEPVPEPHPPEAISAEAAAAAVRSAFAYEEEALAEGAGSGAARTARAIQIDLGLLAEDPDHLRIELPDGRNFVAVRQVSWIEEGDRRYWSGELYAEGQLGKEADGTLSLFAEGGIVAGALRAGGVSFEIVPLEEGRQQLVPAAAAVRAGGKAAPCADEAAPSEAAPEATLRPSAENSVIAPSVVDVLVIFPQRLAATPTQLMQTRAKIGLWFGDANQVLANSGVSHRFDMVYSGPLSGAQPPVPSPWKSGVEKGTLWLMEHQPEVAALQNTWKADLVALFVPADDHISCGAAEPGNPSDKRYATIDLGCDRGEYLVAHELGHLLGMNHDPLRLVIGGRPAASVMGCNGNGSGGPIETLNGNQCSRIPYFSSPSIRVDGVLIGDHSSNDAQIAQSQMPVTAERQSSLFIGNRSPRLTLLRPQGTRAQRGQSLTLSARVFDTEDGNIESNIRWTSNRRGPLGTGGLLRVPSPGLGGPLGLDAVETFTASVRDSGGLVQTLSVMVTYVPQVETKGAIWHDPGTPGRFLSFNKNMYGDWVATFMTFEGENPVWYLSGVGPVAGNGAFFSPLYRYTRGPAPASLLTPATIGYLSISVETERQIRLMVTPFSGPPVDLMLEPYTEAKPPSEPGGYWSESQGQVDAGWVIFRGPIFERAGVHARFVATYDGSQPVWVFSTGIFGSSQGEEVFRPLASTMPDNFRLPASGGAGSLTWATGASNASLALRFPSGNVWNRSQMPMVPFSIR